MERHFRRIDNFISMVSNGGEAAQRSGLQSTTSSVLRRSEEPRDKRRARKDRTAKTMAEAESRREVSLLLCLSVEPSRSERANLRSNRQRRDARTAVRGDIAPHAELLGRTSVSAEDQGSANPSVRIRASGERLSRRFFQRSTKSVGDERRRFSADQLDERLVVNGVDIRATGDTTRLLVVRPSSF